MMGLNGPLVDVSNASGAGNLFDGDTSTAYGPDGNTQTFTPPKPIVVKNRFNNILLLK